MRGTMKMPNCGKGMGMFQRDFGGEKVIRVTNWVSCRKPIKNLNVEDCDEEKKTSMKAGRCDGMNGKLIYQSEAASTEATFFGRAADFK